MYYVNCYTFLEEPEKDWAKMIQEAKEIPPEPSLLIRGSLLLGKTDPKSSFKGLRAGFLFSLYKYYFCNILIINKFWLYKIYLLKFCRTKERLARP